MTARALERSSVSASGALYPRIRAFHAVSLDQKANALSFTVRTHLATAMHTISLSLENGYSKVASLPWGCSPLKGSGFNTLTAYLLRIRVIGCARLPPEFLAESRNKLGQPSSAIYPYSMKKFIHFGSWLLFLLGRSSLCYVLLSRLSLRRSGLVLFRYIDPGLGRETVASNMHRLRS